MVSLVPCKPSFQNLKWFEFRQNNSGGVFVADKNLSVHVYIEATTPAAANQRAQELGIYFDGFGDCPCCGNRWCEVWEGDEGESFEELGFYAWKQQKIFPWGLTETYDKDAGAVFHFADGRVMYGVEVEPEGDPEGR